MRMKSIGAYLASKLTSYPEKKRCLDELMKILEEDGNGNNRNNNQSDEHMDMQDEEMVSTLLCFSAATVFICHSAKT